METMQLHLQYLCNQDHKGIVEETAQGSESHLLKYLSAFPLALNWKNVPNIMSILKVEFNLFGHVGIDKKTLLTVSLENHLLPVHN